MREKGREGKGKAGGKEGRREGGKEGSRQGGALGDSHGPQPHRPPSCNLPSVSFFQPPSFSVLSSASFPSVFLPSTFFPAAFFFLLPPSVSLPQPTLLRPSISIYSPCSLLPFAPSLSLSFASYFLVVFCPQPLYFQSSVFSFLHQSPLFSLLSFGLLPASSLPSVSF